MSIIGNGIMVGGGSSPTPSGYQVIWLDWDNTVLSILTYAQGATPSYPSGTPIRTNTLTHSYTFKEWTPTITTVSENIVYKATYTTTIVGCIEFSSDDEFSLSKSALWDGTVEYLDNNTTWTTWDGSLITSSLNSEGVLTIALRGINNTYVRGSATTANLFIVQASDSLSLNGNIENLLDYLTVLNNLHPTMSTNCFEYLFRNFSWLNHVDKNLLPATSLPSHCYLYMFLNSGICELPNLPATSLASNCYRYMFSNCSYIFNIPATLLPATTLAAYCYSYMFENCGGITTLPATLLLLATTMLVYCYQYMFYGCANITSIPTGFLPATTLASYCYKSMFLGCTALTSIPATLLPATSMYSYCYDSMFRTCSALTSVPSSLLPATTLATYCYLYMFYNCTHLTNIPNLPATSLSNYCYLYMFQSCTSLVHLPTGLFSTLTSLGTYCCRAMFYGCTSLVDLVALKVTSLKSYCYNLMFYGCSLIKLSTTQVDEYQTEYRIPFSGTGTTASNALGSMFASTGGTFTGTAIINTTYYTNNTVIS